MRDEICPLDSKGSKVYWNRAGDKLQEVYDCIPFFGKIKYPSYWLIGDSFIVNSFIFFYYLIGDLNSPVEFFDVCGGPGAWSQFLLERLPRGSNGYNIL